VESVVEYSIFSYFLIGVSALLIGFSKASVGGLVIVVVPLVAMAVPGPESTGMILPMMIIGDIFAVIMYRQECNWRLLLKIFPVTALGVVVGFSILRVMPTHIFEPVLGLIILTMMALGYLVEKRPFSTAANRLMTWFVGSCAGVSTMVANAAGPLMGIYLLQQGLPKMSFVGTRSMFFLLLNMYKLPFSSQLGFVTVDSLKVNLMFLPVIILGGIVGAKVLKYINLKVFKMIVRLAAFGAAIKLILT
jgi:uncharacterized protein